MSKDLHDQIMNLPCKRTMSHFLNHEEMQLYKEGHGDARHAAAELALATPPVASGALPELPEPLEINWPTLNRNALGCGVEDRGLNDRYECAEYGWDDGVDRAIECVPEAIYDADQMRAYGQACAAAAAPNAALVAALTALMGLIDEFGIKSGVCCCGDDMKRHDNPMDCGHSPVDSGEYYSEKPIEFARAALAQAGAA